MHLLVFCCTNPLSSLTFTATETETEIVPSSAKLHRAPSWMKRNMSFMKRFKSNGPSIEPWGTPWLSGPHELNVFLLGIYKSP